MRYPIAIDRARLKLGWEPRHRLRDTIPETVRQMKRNPRPWYEQHDIEPPKGTA